MARRRKAGRKRKAGPRTPAGQRSRAYTTIARDLGTMELQLKRRELVGESADPDLSATAIQILLAHGCLDDPNDADAARERCNAALRYAILAGAVYGPRWPSNGSGREITEEQQLKLSNALARLERRLTYTQRQLLDRTARSNWQPTWFQMLRLGKPLTTEDEHERAELLAALDAIRGNPNRAAA